MKKSRLYLSTNAITSMKRKIIEMGTVKNKSARSDTLYRSERHLHKRKYIWHCNRKKNRLSDTLNSGMQLIMIIKSTTKNYSDIHCKPASIISTWKRTLFPNAVDALDNIYIIMWAIKVTYVRCLRRETVVLCMVRKVYWSFVISYK